jgi:teichuronic acid biosynthesis glycosyltransferase TuaC
LVKKRLLFISNLFPNPLNKSKCTFNFQQIKALQKWFDIDVICPIAWTERIKINSYTYFSTIEGVPVHYPTYYFAPKILRKYYGFFYFQSIYNTCEVLFRQKAYEAVFASWIFPDCWAAGKIALKNRLPFYGKIHGTDVNQLKRISAITEKALWVVSNSQKIFSVSQELKDQIVHLGGSGDKIAVIYNGIDKSLFRSIDKGLAQQKTVGLHRRFILYVGNFKKEKGIEQLLKTYASINSKYFEKQLWLYFIGSGPYENAMRNFIARHNLAERVILLGRKEPNEVALWMNAAAVLCLPSYSEGLPNVVIEALSVGTRVVATDVGGVHEIKNAKGLRIVPPKNISALQTALEEELESQQIARLPDNFGSWEDNARQVAGEIINSGS